MYYKRILITGANGLLGQELVGILGADGQYDVLATSRDPSPRFESGSCGYISLDVTKNDRVRSVMEDFSPDVVVNCAAMTAVDRCEDEKQRSWQLNVDAVETLSKQCLRLGSRLVQLSTDFVFDGLSGPYTETDRPNPLSHYGKSKLASENAARMAGRHQWAVVRTVLVFGSGIDLQRSNFVTWVIKKLRNEESIEVVTDQFRSPTYVRDLASGIERVIRFGKTGIYNISGREQMSVYEMAVLVAERFDLDSSLIRPTDSTRFTQPALRPLRTGFITLKAESEIGYKPHTFVSALNDLSHNPVFLSQLSSTIDND